MLPELRECPNDPAALIGQVVHGGRALDLTVIGDGDPMPQVLGFAERAVAALQGLEAMAKLAAANALLATYNECWRHHGIVGKDGPSIEIHGPELSSDEFQARLRLHAITVTGATCICLCFGDGRMFAGHSVFVTSFDGLQFANTHAELFG
ncbi:MAG: DUF2262 domain-containing protein [Planctomycetes bacterium]|nr:DUF2262 domain-containing protein [Planctomycetota bacterium]